MPTRVNYQNQLKERYGINKNISNALSPEECEALWEKLEKDSEILNLVQSFIAKNKELTRNNNRFGTARGNAERKLAKLQQQHDALEQKLQIAESAAGPSVVDGGQMSTQVLELQQQNDILTHQLQQLHHQLREPEQAPEDRQTTEQVLELQQHNDALTQQLQQRNHTIKELTKANDVLQKDNKDLKNTMDKIRLEVTRKIKELLQQEDNELRKSMVRMFKGMLG